MIYWFYRNKIAALFGIDRVGKILTDYLFGKMYHYVITGSRDGSERLYVAVGAEESA